MITIYIIEIPSSLKETIYDVTTPKSDKVKRNLSDRVITPGKGGKKEVIYNFLLKPGLSKSIAVPIFTASFILILDDTLYKNGTIQRW